MKILTVVGARPQFIKAAPVSREIRKIHQEVLVHTGQHYDYQMSDVFFRELGIPAPDHDLEVGSGTHGVQTGEMLIRLERVVSEEKPALVLVYGDTNSTLAGALVASKMHCPVAHVEAGLRSFNKEMPEEINRVMTDHMSTVLFCPSETAVRNLAREGITDTINHGKMISLETDLSRLHEPRPDSSHPVIVNVGDVMYDVLRAASVVAGQRSTVLRDLDLKPKQYQVLTIHRAENTDDPRRFEEIIAFVNRVSADTTVVFPRHPRTKKMLETTHKRLSDTVRTIEPLGYFDMIALTANSELIYTDSGGLQKEAYWLQVPCITLRDQTEWIETVHAGWNVLFRDYRGPLRPVVPALPLYGDGNAAGRIAAAIYHYLR
jgi:UDP-N-acetylglucosamine 2-epimerase